MEQTLSMIKVTLADVVQIQPSEFHKNSYRAIEDFINAKYADNIIPKVGLGVGFHSLISASEGLIGHGNGIVNVNVDFRLVVFRPFKGEILRATITQSNPSGIYLSADFFEDIVVPPETLFENTKWEKDDQGAWAFVWRADDGNGGVNEFYFDTAESCMLRVEEEQWHDMSPEAIRDQEYAAEQEAPLAMRAVPYRVRGSMMHSGLGPTLWWTGEGVEEDAIAEQQRNGGDETMGDE